MRWPNVTNRSRTVPVTLRTGWIDFSPALHAHAAHSMALALRPFASCVRAVTIDLTEHEPSSLERRRCTVEVVLEPHGMLTTTVTGVDVRELIDRAAAALMTALRTEFSSHSTADPLARIA